MRLLHFLALAMVVLWLFPRSWKGLSSPVLHCAKLCGENSLPIYCLGVLLALASRSYSAPHLRSGGYADCVQSCRNRSNGDRSEAFKRD
nr:OpgC domain-containing protein [Bradyrhizobium sp. CCBAU 65884]